MQTLAFSMSGDPRAKGRPRLSTRGGFARAFTDPKTRAYEKSIREIAALRMRGAKPFEGPLSLCLRFRLSPPASMSKRQRARVLAGEEAYFGRIDIDNCVKAIADPLNGVCWVDDKQIVRLLALKVAASTPGVDVEITAYEPQGES